MKTSIRNFSGRLVRNAPVALFAMLVCMFTATEDSLGAELTLRSSISVSDDVIRIGDLLHNAGKDAEIAIFRAPSPGKIGVLTANRISYALRNHGLRWRNTTGVTEVTIARDGRVIPLADIKTAIAQKLEHTRQIGSAGEIALTFARNTPPLVVASDATGPVEALQVNYEPRNGRFVALVTAPGLPKRRYAGRLTEVIEAPVLKHRIERDHQIVASDIEMRKVPRTRLIGAIVLDPRDLVGRAVSRTLRAGTTIRKRDVREIRMVKKNTVITILYQIPGLSLATKGRAVQAGVRGDVVMVRNIRSRKVIEAEVIGFDTVRAITMAPLKITQRKTASIAHR